MKKDRIIKIFREKKCGGNLIKSYIHDINGVKASVRALKIAESVSRAAVEDDSIIECTVNNRDIKRGDYVEWKGVIYRISIIDPYDFKSRRDIKFQAEAANLKEYSGEEYLNANVL